MYSKIVFLLPTKAFSMRKCGCFYVQIMCVQYTVCVGMFCYAEVCVEGYIFAIMCYLQKKNLGDHQYDKNY